MRIVFIGCVEFSSHALERLLELKAEIVGVCTLKESKFNADHVDLSGISTSRNIPWMYASDINLSKTLDWIRDKSPDVIFCFGWSRLLEDDLLKLAPLGVIGFHPAALPANRGRHPLIWALVLGLKKTASTFFFMDGGADSGDILSQREIIIHDEDDARTLYDKVTNAALEQITEFHPQLTLNSFHRQTQDVCLANIWRKRGASDGQIDWRMSAQSIHNLVRGLVKPYAGASFFANGMEIRVWKTKMVHNCPENIESGKVLELIDTKPVIKCGDEAICLLVTEPSFEPSVGSYL